MLKISRTELLSDPVFLQYYLNGSYSSQGFFVFGRVLLKWFTL